MLKVIEVHIKDGGLMLNWVGRLFGTEKAAESLVNNISNGLDKMYYSSEEQAEDRAQAVREGNQVYIEWLKSTTGSRLARRFIAISVTCVWLLQYIVLAGMGAILPWIETPSTIEAIKQSIEYLTQSGEQMNAAEGFIMAFYFLGNKADGLIKASVDKWNSK